MLPRESRSCQVFGKMTNFGWRPRVLPSGPPHSSKKKMKTKFSEWFARVSRNIHTSKTIHSELTRASQVQYRPEHVSLVLLIPNCSLLVMPATGKVALCIFGGGVPMGSKICPHSPARAPTCSLSQKEDATSIATEE